MQRRGRGHDDVRSSPAIVAAVGSRCVTAVDGRVRDGGDDGDRVVVVVIVNVVRAARRRKRGGHRSTRCIRSRRVQLHPASRRLRVQ